MMLTLMGGSIFGLHAFHASNLTLVDQLRELGASKDLLQGRRPARGRRATGRPRSAGSWSGRSRQAQKALVAYFEELKKNTTRGNRADDGRDELGLAFADRQRPDGDPGRARARADRSSHVLPGTSVYLGRHPEVAGRPRRRPVAGPLGSSRDRAAEPVGSWNCPTSSTATSTRSC